MSDNPYRPLHVPAKLSIMEEIREILKEGQQKKRAALREAVELGLPNLLSFIKEQAARGNSSGRLPIGNPLPHWIFSAEELAWHLETELFSLGMLIPEGPADHVKWKIED